MQVKAIYEDGAINITSPLRFKHRKFEVVVNIPEAEIDDMHKLSDAQLELPGNGQNNSSGESVLAKIKQILGSDFHPRPPSTVEQDRETLIEALEARYCR